MSTSTMIYVAVGLIAVIGGIYYYFYSREKKSLFQPSPAVPPTAPSQSLQLAAYERLVILAERISIPSLVSRSNQPGLGKADMQLLLVQTIRQEFDHNLSQQIYVSQQAWEAVRNLKEQNIHLINQIASVLPAEASGLDLNRKILEFVTQQPNGSMHVLVQDALSYEAKKLM